MDATTIHIFHKLVAFLDMSSMCLLKINLLSIITPK